LGEKAAQLVIDANESRPGNKAPATASPYRVRLLFATPQTSETDLRRFDVTLQGQTLAEDVTITPTGPVSDRFAERTFNNVMIANELQITLHPKQGTPVLSGIEIRKVE